MKIKESYAVVLAFAIIYIVWGSTFIFIQKALEHIPPLILGAFRFFSAGVIMLLFCAARGERLFLNFNQLKHATITGLLMLTLGNGSVIWAEKTVSSSFAAVFLATGSLWFVLLDRPNWDINLKNRTGIVGILFGIVGVVLLFTPNFVGAGSFSFAIGSLFILCVATVSWAAGSLYSKAKSIGSIWVNAGWQMFSAGFAFILLAGFSGEWAGFDWQLVPVSDWFSVVYLVVMGSLAGHVSFMWLLTVRPVTQVSTHMYINPLVAVILGVLFAGERFTGIQFLGLLIILISVLFINLTKYKKVFER